MQDHGRNLPERGAVILCLDEDVRDLLNFWLSDSGVPSAVAQDGHDAADKLRERAWRLLLTDRFLPPWPGLDTILRLKELYEGLRVVVVEDGNPVTRGLAKAVGADATLTRPLRRASVLAAVGVA